MADERRCDNTEPHPLHGWEEEAPDAPRGKKFHVCRGRGPSPTDPAQDLLDTTGTDPEQSNELADIVAAVYRDWWGSDSYAPLTIRYGIAHRIQRAGYTRTPQPQKPTALAAGAAIPSVQSRVVSTVEELDALPEQSVVLDYSGRAYSKESDSGVDEALWFATASPYPAKGRHILPARVLFTPDERNKQ